MLSRIIRSVANRGPANTVCRPTLLVAHRPPLLQSFDTPLGFRVASRALSVRRVSRNLSLITAPGRKIALEKDQWSPTQKVVQASHRPLVVMVPWLMAKPSHVMKFASLYTSHGFDVLSVRLRPWHVLLPVQGSQVVAGQLLEFLRVNEAYDPLVVHGFSVGGYFWGELCIKVLQAETFYKPVVDRVVGQVWDSAVDVTQTPVGMARALFPKNATLQSALHNVVKYHMRAFHDVATKHYIRSSQMFHTNLVRAPALFLVSKTDPMGSEESNRRVHDYWAAQGIKTHWKCWDCSPHVGHMKEHPEEYATELNTFLKSLDLATKSVLNEQQELLTSRED